MDDADTPDDELDPAAVAIPEGQPPFRMCGAGLRRYVGRTCRKPCVPGRNRCKMHGGATLTGAQSGMFKTGLYSKSVPKNLRADFQKLMSDPALLEGRCEVALLQIRLTQLSSRVGTNESNKTWQSLRDLFEQFRNCNAAGDNDGQIAALGRMNGIISGQIDDDAAWSELTGFIEIATKVAEREWKRVLKNRQVATIEQVRALFSSVADAILTHVQDPITRQRICEHLDALRVIGPLAGTGAE